MHYEVESDRQSCGSCSGETHRVVKVEDVGFRWLGGPATVRRTVVAVFRRRDMAEELCGEFNKPRGYVASAVVLMEQAA